VFLRSEIVALRWNVCLKRTSIVFEFSEKERRKDVSAIERGLKERKFVSDRKDVTN